jgi:negative regulator of flagellin synthesis FlgM
MKIDSSYKPSTAAVTPRPAATSTTSSSNAQEAVSLSSLAGALQGGETPPVNTARIQEIKQAISDGRFQINPEAIADRLIESARDLVSKPQA